LNPFERRIKKQDNYSAKGMPSVGKTISGFAAQNAPRAVHPHPLLHLAID